LNFTVDGSLSDRVVGRSIFQGSDSMLGPDRRNLFARRESSTIKTGPQTAEQAQAVRRFVAQVGGFENARRALDLLALLSGKRA
jgi:hypothetical protein